MPPAGQGRAGLPSADDQTLWSLVVSAAGTAFLAWYVWAAWHTEISAGFVQVAHWHIKAMQRFTDGLDPLDRAMLAADPSHMTPAKLWEVAAVIAACVRIPSALLLASLGVLCFLRAAPARFTRRLDLDGLRREQAATFRTAAAFLDRPLGIVAPRAGEPRPADPALHPHEWIELHGLRDGHFDAVAVRAELARQLGPLWLGAADAAPHARVLYAAFGLHLVQRRWEALELLGDLAEGLADLEPGEGPAGPERPLMLPGAVVKLADQVLRDPEVSGAARAVAGRHGYAAPALMSLLNEARRRSGVLAPAQFNGLKLVDRRLWYALHSLGFPAEGLGRDQHPNPLVEAIGARDHWAAECAARGPLLVPSLDRAAAAIRAAAGDAAAVT